MKKQIVGMLALVVVVLVVMTGCRTAPPAQLVDTRWQSGGWDGNTSIQTSNGTQNVRFWNMAGFGPAPVMYVKGLQTQASAPMVQNQAQATVQAIIPAQLPQAQIAIPANQVPVWVPPSVVIVPCPFTY